MPFCLLAKLKRTTFSRLVTSPWKFTKCYSFNKMASGTVTSIEKSNGPEDAFVPDLMSFMENHEGDIPYIAGDTFAFPGLKKKADLQLIEAKAEEMPPYDTRDDDIYGDFDGQIRVIVHADSKTYKAGDGSNETLLKTIKTWLQGDKSKYSKILSQVVVKSEPAFHEVCTTMLVDSYCLGDFIGGIKDSPFFHDVWNKHMNKIVKEGVCYSKGKIPHDLCQSLAQNVNELAEKTPIDYHPNSNDIVRDLVHPALYPYIKGVSKLKANVQLPKDVLPKEDGSDLWGRPYEDSKFQWLPTPFKITAERKCLIQDYINNLDQTLFPNLYKDLASLFEIFLPYFEEVWSYAKGMNFFQGDDNEPEEESAVKPFKKEKVSFDGQELQIITKIVDYTLQPEQAYEGVWHAEGMSHENIVMTGIYFLDRDPNLVGGDLRFKRAFSTAERAKVFWNAPQDRPIVVSDFAAEGFVPLGYFPTEQDYMLVFPNCHIHKIAKLINSSKEKAARRRIVVFFFVNPEKRIVSTREVPPQQNSISLRVAKQYRLELMAERKYDKEKLNVRDIELCEH